MQVQEEKKRSNNFIHSLFSRVRAYELSILLASALAAGGVWIFMEIADEVFEGKTSDLDEALLLSLRNPADVSDPIGPFWFEEVMRDFTSLGGTAILVAICLAVLGFLLLQKKWGMVVFTAAAVTGGFLLSSTLKRFFDRPRPDIVPHSTYVMTASFPSGHSMLSAVVFLTLGGLLARYISNRRLKIYVLTLSVLTTVTVGCSRVYLGVHWPTDVLAGWTAGASWALVCWMVALLLQRRGQVEEELED
ncbi:MAG TPA: phosphatase PAP2 family protein [Desulfopila sp.]|nr:phosphatase PAP2 family protein [Desulfopila sp.]